MMKLAILFATVSCAAAFAPSSSRSSSKSMLFSTPTEEAVAATESTAATSNTPADIPQPAPAVKPINGWVPDESLVCYGLPGAVAPTGYFDPLGFARSGITLDEIKRNREAEVMHGRVSGLNRRRAAPDPFGITGPANDQLQQMPAIPFTMLASAIAAFEIRRAQIGWVEPDLGDWTRTLWKLRDNYYPGDIGFDPLGLKPKDAKDFANMQTRELQNGRLAMIGWAGMCAQELVNHRTIFGTIEFYQKVYAGVNPYEGCADGVIC
eukprot:CAMPEP_0172575402 /NCGR_PEP_ID=MMETSP1067-20121228/137196_1 /TAXON_ID=265564 ORGANISM="Thalassiosira punctigera, Strain Tpunct2005C2" /NCGR_SAMPLE_ID=MMETSP1067 /ASSEMBLY_ACC=CAM_ASM_000444 /LENGTH=264 /DNA_ID=CAMNT_0013368051 /DNA_START=74 /DNA_END=869 /DNA_ORIENTATION=-